MVWCLVISELKMLKEMSSKIQKMKKSYFDGKELEMDKFWMFFGIEGMNRMDLMFLTFEIFVEIS